MVYNIIHLYKLLQARGARTRKECEVACVYNRRAAGVPGYTPYVMYTCAYLYRYTRVTTAYVPRVLYNARNVVVPSSPAGLTAAE